MASALVLIKNGKDTKSEDILREGFKRYGITEYSLDYNKYKKPYLRSEKLFFNISHSGSYICCAFSEAEIGLDIEEIGPVNLSIAKRFFSEDEYEYIEGSDNKLKAFYEIWTKKEAYTKALGLGMAYKFNTFSVLKEKYIYEMSDLSGYMMAIASKIELEQIKTELL